MLLLATDENINLGIIRGLRALPGIDLARVQDFLATGAWDPDVLAWAAAENRVLITCDKNTMISFAKQRLVERLEVPGLIVFSQKLPIGMVIDQIAMIAECMGESEMRENFTVFLPYRS